MHAIFRVPSSLSLSVGSKNSVLTYYAGKIINLFVFLVFPFRLYLYYHMLKIFANSILAFKFELSILFLFNSSIPYSNACFIFIFIILLELFFLYYISIKKVFLQFFLFNKKSPALAVGIRIFKDLLLHRWVLS